VSFIIILVAMLIFMYFLLIRPQRQQQRRTQDMLSKLAPGDEVITVGGIYGDVIEVHEDRVVLEIAEDVQVEVTRRAISNIVPPEPEEIEDVDEEPAEAEETVAEAEDEVEERAR
jgi:preprotein translocase subunit YajC